MKPVLPESPRASVPSRAAEEGSKLVVEIDELRHVAYLRGGRVAIEGTGGARHLRDVESTFVTAATLAREAREEGRPGVVGGGLLAVHFAVAGVSQKQATLFAARDRGGNPELARSASAALPLAAPAESDAIDLLFVRRELSEDDVRAAQLGTNQLRKREARAVHRLVLDTIERLDHETLDAVELSQLFHAIVLRFKALGVTSMFTIESKAVAASPWPPTSPAKARSMLRYMALDGPVEHALSIVRTRSEPLGSVFPARSASGGLLLELAVRSASLCSKEVSA